MTASPGSTVLGGPAGKEPENEDDRRNDEQKPEQLAQQDASADCEDDQKEQKKEQKSGQDSPFVDGRAFIPPTRSPHTRAMIVS
jgi:hypothetical protein